ncbi:MAG: ATP-binding protein [Beijerinckiaceae bacterium]
MTQALQAFRTVDFNSTHDLQGIWSDPVFQVDELNNSTVDRIMDDFLLYTRNVTDNPIGRVVMGEAGTGKTHLIGTLRRRVWQAQGWFVLLDIVGITDFWVTAVDGFVASLHQTMANGQTQYQAVLSKVLEQVPLDEATKNTIGEWERKPEKTRLDTVDLFLRLLRRIDRTGTTRHQDVIRALLLLDSDDTDASNLAYSWLLGLEMDESKRRDLKFLTASPLHHELVRGMLWVMSLAGPTLIAVDEIDDILAQSNWLVGVEGARGDDSERRARYIIETLAGGLRELHNLKRRAITVVSCLETSWQIIKEKAIESAAHRFEELPVLEKIKNRDIVEDLIGCRLDKAYAEASFHPPYRTWPFRREAIDSAVGLLPRKILIRCKVHRDLCIARGEVLECTSLERSVTAAPEFSSDHRLDEEFQRQQASADITGLLDHENEDTLASDLLIRACELFLNQFSLPDSIDAIVKSDPDRKKPSVHARLSFTFRDEGDREQHYCFRCLAQAEANAFRPRLKAAMNASGIDRDLKFRHLFILRRGDPPGGVGTQTKQEVDKFTRAGGKFIAPTDEDLRVFVALRAMADRDLPGFEAWLGARKPLFDTMLFNAAGLCPPPFLPLPPAPPNGGPRGGEPLPGNDAPVVHTGQRPAEERADTVHDREGRAGQQLDLGMAGEATDAHARRTTIAPRIVPIGRRFERGALGDPVTLAADLLPCHIAILAGTGSGKTVFLRRIIEEAALLDIPAIVLDINNDLSRLGDTWPAQAEGFSDEDAAKAATYHARADVVVWTPGVASGNPVSLNLLPDFSAIGDKEDSQTEDERSQAVEMARATLAPYLGGTGQRALLRQGVLADALRAFAKKGGGKLDDLIRLLSDLPEDISRIADAPRLASDIANQLLAAIATNPLLQSSGLSLDPQRLFEGGDGKTRISVINLGGLASDAARQSFVNQLQMMLFTWIKQNPSPTGRLYVLDEAQNFAPSQTATACKASTLSLVKQARKYGLGMIFATQLPKGIDNAIVSNCMTHVYGRMSAPATIQATHELMAAKGGAAEDIGRLTKGEFYFSTDGFNRPVKIRTPLCLSWHPPNPPTADEVVQKARAKQG